MTHAAMLTAMGVAMLLWRPCRSMEGRAPRSAITLLVLSVIAVWVGSASLALSGIVEGSGVLPAACARAWQAVTAEPPWNWRVALVAAWMVAFPLRAGVQLARRGHTAGALRRRLLVAGTPLPGHAEAVLVDGLDTPAVTVGTLRPLIAVDADFWVSASPAQREVVLAHEHAHRRAHHGLLVAAAVGLAAPLRPLPAARELIDCVRRHLEALADDTAARHTGRARTGRTLAELSLADPPDTGLAVAGDGLWRARRLLTAAGTVTVADRVTVQVPTALMAACAAVVTFQLASVAVAAWATPLCSL